jgi:hypothetical protein
MTSPPAAKNGRKNGSPNKQMNQNNPYSIRHQLQFAEGILKSLKREIQASQKSLFPVPGYHEQENIFIKILDLKSSNRNSHRINVRATDRILRCKNCFYAPFEQTDQVFITNFGSYKHFKDQGKTNIS